MAGMKHGDGRSGWCMRRDYLYDVTDCARCQYTQCTCLCHSTAAASSISETLRILASLEPKPKETADAMPAMPEND